MRASSRATTVATKIVMAVTGIVMVGFLAAHMLGNLLVFQGADAINGYAETLRAAPMLLWKARGFLLLAAILHIASAIKLIRLQRAARPDGYQHYRHRAAGVGTRTMRWSGLLLAVFIILHILHYTTGTIHPDFRPGDVFANLVTGFSNPLVAVLYLIAMVMVGLHLSHGIASLFQTLGVTHPLLQKIRRPLSVWIAIGITAGFAAIPFAALLGLLP